MIAFGDKAHAQARLAERSLRDVTGLPLSLVWDNTEGLPDKAASRSVKTDLLNWTQFSDTLYLDADTRVQGDVTAGFEMLDAGWDIAMAPSTNQGKDAFWHVSDKERDETIRMFECVPLQMQCGVMFVRKNERTEKFFSMWHAEWKRYGGEDQGAFMRALRQVPVKIWILGRPWNGGAVIQHRFGACR